MNTALLMKMMEILVPALQVLGQKAIEKGAEKLGEKGAEGLAGKIWQMLKPKVEQKPAAIEAAVDVAAAPNDEDAIASLRQQLKKILEAPENVDLAAKISKLLAESGEGNGAKSTLTITDNAVCGAVGNGNNVTQNIGNYR